MSAKPKPSALMNALILTSKSADAAGKLPPSSCKQHGSTMVTCIAPFTGISGVVFQTYPNLKALYAAYTATVESLNTSHFQQNYNDCGLEQTVGEVGWNHQFQHPNLACQPGWQDGHQKVTRSSCPALRMGVPQRRHGRPRRP